MRNAGIVVALLVALRLAAGWHFFNEGVKKLEPGFSSAGFLRSSTGPLAPFYRGMVRGPHGAMETLTAPVEQGSRSASDQAALAKWESDYGKRAGEAMQKGATLPSDYPAAAPYAAWLDRIDADWDRALARLSRSPSASKEFLAKTKEARSAAMGRVVYALWGQRDAIDAVQHEAWRLERLREEAGKKSAPPFLRAQIADKENEVWGAAQPIAGEVQRLDDDFRAAVASAAASEPGLSPKRVEELLAERSVLRRIDFVVTWTVIGVGVLLFLGLFTPVAGVVGALFLLSVMASQPPWVAGADTKYFFYQLVEVVALLLLAASGAGHWAGLDGVYGTMRRRFGDLAPQRSGATAARAA